MDDSELFLQMYELIVSYVKPCMVYCAVKYDIIDHLSKSTMNAQRLSQITNTNEVNLYRLLRGLASIGILKADENKKFSVTKFGETLKESGTFSLKNTAKLLLTDHFTAFANLSYAIETGGNSFERTHEAPIYEFLKNKPQKEEIFAQAMRELTNLSQNKLFGAYDFSKFRRIVDVGGGHGSFLRLILCNNKEAVGILFDQEYVIEKARKSITEEFGERCLPVSGSFFESVPASGDCYLLKHIIVNWKDDEALHILRNIRHRMNIECKLVIVEALVNDDDNEPELSKLRDISMMAVIGGITRTKKQYEKLLEKAELQLSRVIEIPHCLDSIIEAVIC